MGLTVTPEVVGPIVRIREREEEVLELGESQQDGCLDDVDAEFLEYRMVQVPGVLKSELSQGVGPMHARVLDDVNLLRRPAGGDIGYDGLQQHGPCPREAYEEWRRNG